MKTVVRYLFVLVLIVLAAPVYAAPPAQSAVLAEAAPPAPSAVLAQAATPAKSVAPASSDSGTELMHISMCEMNEGTSEEQVDAMAEAKLKALRQMPGGEAAKVHVLWPVAVSNTGNIDFWVVVTFPSSTDFGKFWDAYQDASPAARADDMLEGKVECPDSMLWEAHDTSAN